MKLRFPDRWLTRVLPFAMFVSGLCFGRTVYELQTALPGWAALLVSAGLGALLASLWILQERIVRRRFIAAELDKVRHAFVALMSEVRIEVRFCEQCGTEHPMPVFDGQTKGAVH